jgi:hypothetical protein
MAGLAADLPIGDPILEEWHYVAVVFATGGKDANADGTVTGTVTVYFDGTEPVGVYDNITKDNFGDSLVRSIGVGQHPNGFAADFFDGLVFEPRVSLGALPPDELLYGGGGPGPVTFERADANADGERNITDGIFVLNYLFLGGQTPPCLDAADANDDGEINITDGIFILNFLFLGGTEPPAPFESCGTDPGPDDGVTCLSFPPCGQ